MCPGVPPDASSSWGVLPVRPVISPRYLPGCRLYAITDGFLVYVQSDIVGAKAGQQGSCIIPQAHFDA
jgi:hypothetical protein